MSSTRNWRVTCAAVFASAARSYWLDVFPVVRREVHRLRVEAARIPDPTLRRLALDAQEIKWASLEGAAAFAVLAPRELRPAVARLLVGFQAAYDYADTLMEQPSVVPAANARQLHAAIVAILQPGRPHPDYYRHHVCDQDGGYLTRLVDGCRAVVGELPSYPPLSATIIESTRRIVSYQSEVNLATEQDHPALMRRAAQITPYHSLRWWETWAASGSSLATLALLATAADPTMGEDGRAEAVEALYWPWANALHTLLDSLIDRAEDAATGQHNLLDRYASAQETAERMGFVAAQAARHAVAAGTEHAVILAGMTSLYISDRQAWEPTARPAAESVLDTLGELAMPAILILRARRLVRRTGVARKIRLVRAHYPFRDTP